MRDRFISCSKDQVLDATASLMTCVPRPWTRRMVFDALEAVLDVADQWRGDQSVEIEEDDLLEEFLEQRVDGRVTGSPFTAIVAE
jgi:hypothetical protein